MKVKSDMLTFSLPVAALYFRAFLNVKAFSRREESNSLQEQLWSQDDNVSTSNSEHLGLGYTCCRAHQTFNLQTLTEILFQDVSLLFYQGPCRNDERGLENEYKRDYFGCPRIKLP